MSLGQQYVLAIMNFHSAGAFLKAILRRESACGKDLFRHSKILDPGPQGRLLQMSKANSAISLVAIGLGLRTTYNSGSFTANVVSGVLDSISAGILIYTGLVELLARDFLFNRELTRSPRRLTFMVVCVLLGAALMALLGKWA